MLSELVRIGELDNLKQCVFDNRISKTGRNVRNGCAFLLGLLYFGIHENCTAGTKINGMLCKQSFLCEILNRIIQRLCKGFDKGTAAGRTGFVKLYIIDGVILDADALHILSADIQNTVYLRVEKGSSSIVSDSFDLAFIQHKGRLNKRLAVSGRTGGYDAGFFRKLGKDFL